MARPLYAPKETYVGTGSLDTYTFDFKIEALAQLLIIETDAAGVETQRVRGTDVTYLTSVTFDAVDGAGTVVLAANLTTNYNLILLLANDDPTQDYEFRNKTSFTLRRFENALDLILGAVQRLAYRGRQAFRIHDLDDEDTFDPQFPANIATDGADKVLQVNAGGTGMEFGPSASNVANAEGFADDAEASAAAALVSENAAAADLVLTNADVVLTNADVVLTGLDVASTNADVVLTNADVVLTGLDVVSTNADVVLTNADVVLTGLDVVSTNADVVLTNADVVLTGLDVASTNADVVLTNADVVLTGLDVTAAAASASASAASAVDSANAAAISQWSDVSFVGFGDSPIAPVDASSGTLYIVDTSGGNVVFNMPSISVLGLATSWSVGIKIETDDVNTVTVNRDGTDLFDKADTSVVLTRLNEGKVFIPDTDPSPDSWTTLQFGMVGPTDFIEFEEQAGTPATPASGSKLLYTKTDNKLYTLDDSGNEVEAGSGGTGDAYAVHLIEAGNMLLISEVDLTGNNAAFDGGGTITASSLTLSTTAADLIKGANVIKYVPAADGSDDYFGFTKDIPLGLRGRDLAFTFEFKNDSTVVDDDFRFCVKQKDGTNAGDIDYFNMEAYNTSDDNSTLFVVQSFVGYDCTAIEFGWQNTSATTTVEMYIDNILISSNPIVIKELTNLTDWVAFTPTGSWTTATTYVGYKKQIGDEMHYRVTVSTSAAPTSATLTIDIPDGLIDTAKIFSAAAINSTLGQAVLREDGVASDLGRVTYSSTSVVQVSFQVTGTNNFDAVNETSPFTWGASDVAYLEFSVPIAGLTAKTEHIITTLESVSPARANNNDATAISTATVTFIGFVTDFDTDNLFTNSSSANSTTYTSTTYYTADKKGKYRINAQLYSIDADLDADENFELSIYVNGSSTRTSKHDTFGTIADPRFTPSIGDVLDLEEGDKVSISVYQESGGDVTLTATSNHSWFTVTSEEQFATLGGFPVQRVFRCSDQKTLGTVGGSSTATTWHTRTLNTVEQSAPFASLSANTITLQPGKYYLEFWACGTLTNDTMLMLHDGSDYLGAKSLNHYNKNSDTQGRITRGSHYMSITTSISFTLEHYIKAAAASWGLGSYANLGDFEKYSEVTIWSMN